MAESTGGVLIFPDDDAFLEFMGSLQEQYNKKNNLQLQIYLFVKHFDGIKTNKQTKKEYNLK